MIRFDRRARAFALILAGLAGYVDAVGFVTLGGYFVSFMSGNSTRLSVGLAHGLSDAAIAAGLIGMFVVGVMAGSLAGHAARRGRPAVVLGLVAAMLAAATACYSLDISVAGSALIVAAMGALNTVFEHDGEIRVGLTYMTGALVKTGQRLAAALRGAPAWDWVPHLMLWLSLVAGAVAGTWLLAALGASALWAPVAVAALLALAAARWGLTADGRIAP